MLKKFILLFIISLSTGLAQARSHYKSEDILAITRDFRGDRDITEKLEGIEIPVKFVEKAVKMKIGSDFYHKFIKMLLETYRDTLTVENIDAYIELAKKKREGFRDRHRQPILGISANRVLEVLENFKEKFFSD